MKIGIPRALLFQYYYPLWRSLFENLGFEVVLSDKSSKTLVQKGIAVTVPEICLPIKIFDGHVINLMEKGVDYIFCPRFVHIEKGYWFCPKYIGLPPRGYGRSVLLSGNCQNAGDFARQNEKGVKSRRRGFCGVSQLLQTGPDAG